MRPPLDLPAYEFGGFHAEKARQPIMDGNLEGCPKRALNLREQRY